MTIIPTQWRVLSVLLSSLCLPALSLASDDLVTRGELRVVADDFEAFLLRVPEPQRPEFRASPERVSKAVELIYTNRVLANEARRLGYDKDPVFALRAKQLEEGFLAQVWQQRHQAKVPTPDMLARAREIYRLNPERFRQPERISGEYLQISLVGRTREMAMARAKEAREKWLAGETFAQIAALYNDDANFAKRRGRIDRVTARDLEKPIADAVFALAKPGEITEPIEAGIAIHLFRLESKTPSSIRPFDEVKEALMADEAEKFRGLETDRVIGELKNTPETKIYEENILKLVRELSPAELQASQAGAAKSARPK